MAVKKYLPKGISVEEVYFKKGKDRLIERYSNYEAYKYDDGLELPTDGRPCYIKFRPTEKDNLFTDRVNYVLSYLESQFPEFDWVGVC